MLWLVKLMGLGGIVFDLVKLLGNLEQLIKVHSEPPTRTMVIGNNQVMSYTCSHNSSADDLNKHVMKVFKDATKDCEDKVLEEMFDAIGDYDSLNEYAFHVFSILADSGMPDEAKELFKPRSELAVLPDVAIFTIVIRAYANAGKINAAHQVY
ncbi:hypothetical protein RchiOBHm_Chr7g0236221 [Rosa chinensis]|uniref:Pentatricopeptide n=1 Tax=Rosa chinensis TaxID=74649 RepID=A0A2P6PGX3_ROSCH|nr:hypothetical protein RchiOBHm_Chr7g0236221 [Rosa chinensis]